jgi:hypothetical protein
MCTAFQIYQFAGEMHDNKYDPRKDNCCEHACEIHHHPNMTRIIIKAIIISVGKEEEKDPETKNNMDYDSNKMFKSGLIK